MVGSYGVVWQGQAKSPSANIVSSHTLELTMDDYVTHRGSFKSGHETTDLEVKKFYISDSKNNSDLAKGANDKIRDEIVKYINDNKQQIMANVLMEELSYATNRHNSYASSAGIKYTFNFPATTKEELFEYVDDIGIIAFVQGISIGNKYLNTKSYGVSKLELTTRYYFSIPSENSKYNMNLYHKDTKCLEYLVSQTNDITPSYVLTKQQAASASIDLKSQRVSGFYPCPICKP